MAKAEWGTKRVCLNCGARFYDMLRDPIICPSCETPFDPTANLKSRRGRTAAKAVEEKPVEVVEEDEAEIEEADVVEAGIKKGDSAAVGDEAESGDDDEESESAIEDVSELGDDDVTDVIDMEGEDETT